MNKPDAVAMSCPVSASDMVARNVIIRTRACLNALSVKALRNCVQKNGANLFSNMIAKRDLRVSAKLAGFPVVSQWLRYASLLCVASVRSLLYAA